MATTDINILNNTQKWLSEKGYKHNWLAAQLGISDVYMSQIFSQKRALLPKYIMTISELMGVSVSALSKGPEATKEPVYSLRGKVSNESGKKALVQALLDADRYVSLLADRRNS